MTAWIIFSAFIILMLALDLGVFHRKAHEVSFKEAALWSCVWISLALIFNLGVYYWQGHDIALDFLTAYLIEKSLSIDNVFVILTIMTFFRVPRFLQHKVLFWGILGALVMRGIFIFAGIALVSKFHWLMYVFGAFLVVTGIKMLLPKKATDLEQTMVMKLLRKCARVTPTYDGDRFVVLKHGKKYFTPAFMALIFIEISDVIFAIDSVPAILAITSDPFIVYSSNVFAILGMRSLYFAITGFVHLFRFLHIGLAAVLVFVGMKMLWMDFIKIHPGVSLIVILSMVGLSMMASLLPTAQSSRHELA